MLHRKVTIIFSFIPSVDYFGLHLRHVSSEQKHENVNIKNQGIQVLIPL